MDPGQDAALMMKKNQHEAQNVTFLQFHFYTESPEI